MHAGSSRVLFILGWFQRNVDHFEWNLIHIYIALAFCCGRPQESTRLNIWIKDRNRQIWRRRKRSHRQNRRQFLTWCSRCGFHTPTSEGRRKKRKPKRLSKRISRRLHRSSAIIYLCMLYTGWYGQLLNVAFFFVCVLCEEEQNRSGAMGALHVAICRWVCKNTCTLYMYLGGRFLRTDVGSKNQLAIHRYSLSGMGYGLPTETRNIFKSEFSSFSSLRQKRAGVLLLNWKQKKKNITTRRRKSLFKLIRWWGFIFVCWFVFQLNVKIYIQTNVGKLWNCEKNQLRIKRF